MPTIADGGVQRSPHPERRRHPGGHEDVFIGSQALLARRQRPLLGQQWVIFSSAAGEEKRVPEVSSHSFRKTIATLIDEKGLSARVGADQLGHSNSMTQDRYMKCGGATKRLPI